MFGGAWVFPGGVLDPGDGDIDGDTGDGAGGGHPLRATAVRELAEETGVRLPPSDLHFISRWVTPELMPRRYDTSFFLAVVAHRLPLAPEREEVVEAGFVTPGAALTAHQAQRWKVVLPTLAHLRWLSRFESGEEAIRAAAKARPYAISPRLLEDGSVVEVDLPS